MKFKVGDICIPINRNRCGAFYAYNNAYAIRIIDFTVSKKHYRYDILDKNLKKIGSCSVCLEDKDLKLLTKSKIKMLKRYILLQDTPEFKKGAIFEEECEDGDQDYTCINYSKFEMLKKQDVAGYQRITVEKQPRFFQELRVVSMSAAEEKLFKKLIRNKK